MDIRVFLFGPYPLDFEFIDNLFFYKALGLLVAGLVLLGVLYFKKFTPVAFNLLSRVRNLTLSFGIIGLIWSGLRYENAAYLSWRFWFLAIGLVYAVLFIRLLIYLFWRFKKDLASYRNQEVKQKYLKR